MSPLKPIPRQSCWSTIKAPPCSKAVGSDDKSKFYNSSPTKLTSPCKLFFYILERDHPTWTTYIHLLKSHLVWQTILQMQIFYPLPLNVLHSQMNTEKFKRNLNGTSIGWKTFAWITLIIFPWHQEALYFQRRPYWLRGKETSTNQYRPWNLISSPC